HLEYGDLHFKKLGPSTPVNFVLRKGLKVIPNFVFSFPSLSMYVLSTKCSFLRDMPLPSGPTDSPAYWCNEDAYLALRMSISLIITPAMAGPTPLTFDKNSVYISCSFNACSSCLNAFFSLYS